MASTKEKGTMGLGARSLAVLLGAALAGAAWAGAGEPAASGRLVRDGVAIDFEARPADGGTELVEEGMADIRFRITDAGNGRPLSGLVPGAWLDLAEERGGREGMARKDCKDRVALYLKGIVGVRPLVDLNGYYLLLLNQDPSITVVDPGVSVAGKTSTYGVVMLKRPPMDWARSPDGRRLFVSMPLAGQVAVVDARDFKVVKDVDAGAEPVRLALQPDGRYLWVGNRDGVTVIDAVSLEPVLAAPTGAGHHEIAFSADSRRAFVSNREAGTVTVFDTATLARVADLPVGGQPISLAFSPLAGALYVADGREGRLTVIDGATLETRRTVPLARGLGPLRLTPDGRFALVLNTLESTATVLDTANDEVVHTLAVSAEPYQLAFTRAYAYIRGLASDRVTQVSLASLGKGREPVIQSFAAGAAPPKLAGDLPIADGMAPARTDAGLFVVNPVENTTYFYMEGMNAPMTGYPNRGHAARGALVIDRSLKETEPGVFSARVRLPAQGKLDVAFLLDQPRVMHCFAAEVKPNPGLESRHAGVRASILPAGGPVKAGSRVPVRVRITQGRDARPRTGLADVALRYFRAPAAPAREAAAREVEEGLYEAAIDLPEAGAYYLHVAAPSLGLRFGDQPFATLRAAKPDGN